MPDDVKDATVESSTTTRLMTLLALGLNPLSGGDEEPKGKDGESKVGDGDGKTTDKSADGGTVDTNVPWNQDKRFKEFLDGYKSLKAYKELGDPDTIAEEKRRLAYYDRLAAQASQEPDHEPTKEERDLAEQEKAARAQLRKLEPELGRIAPTADALNTYFASLEQEATDTVESWLKDHDMETSKGNIAKISEVAADIIKADQKLHLRYIRNPEKAVLHALNTLVDSIKPAVERKSKADLQADKERGSKLPKTHGSGGAPSGDKGLDFKDKKAVQSAARALLEKM